MYCKDCGLQIPDGSENCPYCGTSTKIADPHAEHRKIINGSKQAEPVQRTVNTQQSDQQPQKTSAIPVSPKPFGSVNSQERVKPDLEKSGSGNKSQSSAVLPAVSIGIIVIALLFVFVPGLKNSIQLPFGKKGNSNPDPTPTAPTADVSDDSDNTGSNPASTEESADNTEESASSSTAAVFSNEAIEHAVCDFFNVKSSGDLSASDLSLIEEMDISTYEIIINEESFEVTTQLGDIDISEISDSLSGLKTLSIKNARTVSASGDGAMGFTKLKIDDTKVVNNLSGIENAGNLKTLTIHNTDLSSLKYITDCPALTKLNAANNSISDIESLRGTDQITNITLYGNKIKDYTALSKIKTVNVWGEDFNEDEPLSYVFETKPDAYCFTVKITNLHMRAKPSTSSTMLIRHIPQKYYIVLDTKNAEGYTWYKVGNNAWVGDNGSWLKFYNN